MLNQSGLNQQNSMYNGQKNIQQSTSFGESSIKRYERQELLGDGAYGDVFKAKDTLTGQTVALKRMKLQIESEGVPSTVIREISLLAEFSHPNIVKLIDVIIDERQLYVILEYVDHDLRQHLSDMMRDQFLPPIQVKEIMFQLLKATSACHSQKIIHRDLKTPNILITQQGQVKIADFGLARTYSIPIRPYTHEVVTLWYRAPEILLGAVEYSTPVDIWSLGCIFVELITKKSLFEGDCEIGQLYQIFNLLGTPNEDIWKGVSQYKDYSKNFPQMRKKDFTTAIKYLNLCPKGLDLLERMLTYDPTKRITAQNSLNHPYFQEISEKKGRQGRELSFFNFIE